MAKDRAYDPARRPNIFYKNDPASNKELGERAWERGQAYSDDETVGEQISSKIGYDMAKNETDGPTISKSGGYIKNVHLYENGDVSGARMGGATVSNVPISGTALGKTKGLMQGKARRAATPYK